ncbi:hypothetical protein Tco_1574159 [Tanacetum coccineum]
MVINSPCLNNKKELAIPEQTATGKETTNPLMADTLPKTIMPTKLVKPQVEKGQSGRAQLMHLSLNASSVSIIVYCLGYMRLFCCKKG